MIFVGSLVTVEDDGRVILVRPLHEAPPPGRYPTEHPDGGTTYFFPVSAHRFHPGDRLIPLEPYDENPC